MPRTLDRRIEHLDGEPGEWVVTLRAGYAYQDANSNNACHVFALLCSNHT